jgi:penicillin-binding protein 1A
MRPPPSVLPPRPPLRKKRRKSVLLSFLGFAFGSLVLVFLAGASIAGYLVWSASKDLPDYEQLARYEPPVMTRVHAADGSLIAEYARHDGRRIFAPINTIPKLVINAFLAAEDRRFYEHGGIDFVGMGRAGLKFAERLATGRGSLQGASTITQQVAKNFLLTRDQTFTRKLREAILAVRLERAYSKDQILELYLNQIDLGYGGHGVAAAALNYFGKELDKLEVEEVAYLAVLPKAPYGYHPFRQTQRAIDRRNWIIGQMLENGFVTAEQATKARAKPLGVQPRSFGAQIYAAEYFAEEVRRTLVGQYGEDGLYGRADWQGTQDTRVNGGLSVRTTLNPDLQKFARRALIDGLVQVDRDKGFRGPVQKIDIAGDWGVPLGGIDVPTDIAPWRLGVVYEVQRTHMMVGLRPPKQPNGQLVTEREAVRIDYDDMKWANKRPSRTAGPADVVGLGDVIWVGPRDPDKPAERWAMHQIPDLGGGLVAMDPHTGRVLAVVGGFSFATSQFDRALQARRQPGSSFKPLVYAAALDNGYKPTTIVMDAPFCQQQVNGQEWCPKNYEGEKSYGPQTLRHGIEKSRNMMTVRLTEDIGMPLIVEYSKRFGVYDDLLPVLSMSLGAGETTLLRMATAYAVLANGGKQVRATLIDRIQDRWGKTIWRHDDRDCKACRTAGPDAEPELVDDRRQVIDPHTAFQMTSILEGVVQRGTGTRVKDIVPNIPVAGKTGTTNEEKDAWFIGYTPDLVVGVYVGYDTPRPMGKGRTGGQISAPIVANFIKLAQGEKRPVPFRQPPGIKTVRVNAKTGVRATGESDAMWEFFKPFEDPDEPSAVIGVTADGGSAFAPTDPTIDTGPRVQPRGRGGLY